MSQGSKTEKRLASDLNFILTNDRSLVLFLKEKIQELQGKLSRSGDAGWARETAEEALNAMNSAILQQESILGLWDRNFGQSIKELELYYPDYIRRILANQPEITAQNVARSLRNVSEKVREENGPRKLQQLLERRAELVASLKPMPNAKLKPKPKYSQ